MILNNRLDFSIQTHIQLAFLYEKIEQNKISYGEFT